MCNIDKIINLAKSKGITQAHICKIMGERRTYLNEARVGKFSIPDDHVVVIAEVLGTTVEYLTDQTDDPGNVEPEISPEAKKIARWYEQLSDEDKKLFEGMLKRFVEVGEGNSKAKKPKVNQK